MKDAWNDTVITKIGLAIYVKPHEGRKIHRERPFHGFVLNDENSIKEYCFSDGRVLRVEGGTLFYLPKSSSYYVHSIRHGGCYAINFDAEIDDEPFSVSPMDGDALKKAFRIACEEWRTHAPTRHASAMRALYEAVCQTAKRQSMEYMPSGKRELIRPAVELLDSSFADNTLTVASLAERCEMSEVYFRKIFLHSFGISPKEYMIRKRMEYAETLLSAGELSVSQIASLCGYSEACHFSREFKKRFGVPPKEYHA